MANTRRALGVLIGGCLLAVASARAAEPYRPLHPPAAGQLQPVAYQGAVRLPAPAANPEQVDPAEPLPERPELLRPIGMVGVDVTPPQGKLPDDVAGKLWPNELPYSLPFARTWPVNNFHWAASATRHQPLYFEEVNAERYGYTCWAPLQPVASSVHFFGTLPALPYLMGADCPCECQYTLGHYRPGSCVPWRYHYWPLSLRGAAVEAAVVTGTVFVLP